MFHPRCSKLTSEQIACQNAKNSLVQLAYNCAWCKTILKQIKKKKPWLAYDVQTFFKTVEVDLRDEKTQWSQNVKHLQEKMNTFRALITDMQRNNQLERATFQKIEKNLREKTDVVENSVYKDLNDRFLALDETHEKCVAGMNEMRKNHLVVKSAAVPKTSDTKGNDIVKDRPSYAEALKNANVSNKVVRRIAVTDENLDIISNITTAEADAIEGLSKAVSRDKRTATLIFDTEEAVNTFEKQADEKFPGVITVNEIPEYKPRMKIVCLSDIDTPAEDLLTLSRNQETIDQSVELIREYTVTTARRIYRNVIVSCTLDCLNQYMKNGIIIGKELYRCYEH